ncbi:conserved unknown protein [Ectocarpus siliculosus]|uniref:PROP1-like PPR domain-containing protein n=1 Tax=Ectocarpus siliculosus TaxID=2880 RepID=D8LLG9_ECTSI|nr:conserved unknown protein [Ectocarpus siliculosus]|eukprot:CBN76149.1 conserved unknown protein [Ectocarpus siliculosus]
MTMLASSTADEKSLEEAHTSRLEEARMLVRARRQEAKARQAAMAAAAVETATVAGGGGSNSSTTAKDPAAPTKPTLPGSGVSSSASTRSRTSNVDVASGGKKSSSRFRSSGAISSNSRGTRGGVYPRGRPGAESRGARGPGGKGFGVKRRRVLPDFTKATKATAVPVLAAVGDGDDTGLVAAIRATLDQTRAQLAGRKPSTSAAAGGVLPSLTHGATQQGWLRVIGLIRRACGGTEESDRGSSGGPNGAAPGGVESSGVPPPTPPPRVAFELALEVCVLCERPDAGLEVLSLMRSTGLQADLDDYKTVLKGYSANRKQGKALFTVQTMSAVQQAGLVADIEMLSAAMDACSKARDTEGAVHFMDQAIRLGLKPDDTMFREAILAYSLAGKWVEARDLALQWRGQAPSPASSSTPGGDGGGAVSVGLGISRPPPPTVCNTAILKAMGKAGKVDEAIAWLGDTYDAATATATAASGAGTTEDEQGSVRGFVCLDHSSFMAVLSACSKAGRWGSALSVLREMDRAGVTPETVAFNTVLAAFEHRAHSGGSSSGGGAAKREAPRWPMALELLADMERRGVEPDVVTYNSLINVLRWGGQRDRALEILDGMNAKGGAGGVRPDVITYNSAIAACASGGESKKASQLIGEMRRKGLKPDRYSYTSAIHACSKAGNPEEALRLLRAMEASNVVPDVIAMTACMDALAAGGKWSEAITILDEMRSKGVTPNERTYKAAIQACGRGGQWQRALELLSRLENRASGATVQEYNCAMMACVTGGESGRALALLEQMKANKGGVNAGPDMVTYTSAIMACSSTGKWDRALSLLDEMREAGPRTQPNIRSYTAAIAACGRARKWEEAVALHSKLLEEGMSPDPASFNAVIRAARRGGQHKLSMKLLASMVEAGLTPDGVTVGELISSLSDRGRWDDAQRVVEIAEKTGAIPASSLDSDFEVDVSQLPPAIAKVKARGTLQRILDVWRESSGNAEGGGATSSPLEDLVFVTGTGSATKPSPAPDTAAPWAGDVIDDDGSAGDGKDIVIDVTVSDDTSTTSTESARAEPTTTSSASVETMGTAASGAAAGRGGWRVARFSDRSFGLGRVLVEHLRTAFNPPLKAQPREFVAGCLVVKVEDLETWAAAQEGGGSL